MCSNTENAAREWNGGDEQRGIVYCFASGGSCDPRRASTNRRDNSGNEASAQGEGVLSSTLRVSPETLTQSLVHAARCGVQMAR